MEMHFVEVTNGPQNWGKFLLMRFDSEWSARSVIDGAPLIASRGWGPEHLWMLDLQTGEGGCFRVGGSAKYDLDKHRIWVCPMFEPFLAWLYANLRGPLADLPRHVDLPGAEFMLSGHRRLGPSVVSAIEELKELQKTVAEFGAKRIELTAALEISNRIQRLIGVLGGE
jgi:hypothetical protein